MFVFCPRCRLQRRCSHAARPRISTLSHIKIHPASWLCRQWSTKGNVRSSVGYHPKETPHCCRVTSMVFYDARFLSVLGPTQKSCHKWRKTVTSEDASIKFLQAFKIHHSFPTGNTTFQPPQQHPRSMLVLRSRYSVELWNDGLWEVMWSNLQMV